MMRQLGFKLALGATWASGAALLARSLGSPGGIIFTLHRVRPFDGAKFAPNRMLEIEPGFLDRVLRLVRRRGYDLVTLDEAHRRLTQIEAGPFAAFTLDDGYRDNLEHAAPVFARHACPYTVFVTSDFSHGRGELWWLALERIIAAHAEVEIELSGERRTFRTDTPAAKQAAYEAIYWSWRGLPEAEQRAAVRAAAQDYGIDLAEMCRAEIMSWDELHTLLKDPLAQVGAHTVSHPALAKLPRAEAVREMREGAERIAAALGERPRHFSFPYGDPASANEREYAIAAELGFRTAVTTRPGLLGADHAVRLTALPRVSLNGYFQKTAYVDALLSGLPFMLNDALRGREARPHGLRGAASTG